MNQVVKAEQQIYLPEERKQNAANVADFMSLIKVAIERGIDASSLDKMMDVQERLNAKQSEMAFNEAMFRFQSECPPIPFDKTGGGSGSYTYQYASLNQIAKTIKPVLAKTGLSYTFKREPLASGEIRVYCVVRHVAGHSEASFFDIPVDKGARMNDCQKRGSADSYGKRYAISGALGITTGEDDDDAQSLNEPQSNVSKLPGKPPYPDEKIKANSPQWKDRFEKKISVPDNLIRQIRSKYFLTDEQEKKILALVPKKEEAK